MRAIMVIELAINSQADNDTGLTYGQIIESDGINAGQVIPLSLIHI